MKKQKGLVYVFTGNGKGKTSAALGVAVRAVCAGKKVAWISWYKENSWPISERKLPQFLPIDFYLLGKGFFLKRAKSKGLNHCWLKKTVSLKTGGRIADNTTEKEHRKAALVALRRAKEILKTQKYDLLVCDEINNTLNDGLLRIKEIEELLRVKGKTHLIFTGRNVPTTIIEKVDLVTKMRKMKHPYDQDQAAVKGLDY